MKLLVGRKLNMTQLYGESGDVIPVTAIRVRGAVAVQVKTPSRDGYAAVQLGFAEGGKHTAKPVAGHVKELVERPVLRELRVSDPGAFAVGNRYDLSSFSVGEKVSVSGISKGRGFQGVVKRHHFSGSPATHGHKHDLRAPGSIGSTDAQRVFPGKRMAGRMGGERVTTANLTIASIDARGGLLYVRGAVPGARNGLLEIRGEGDMKALQPTPARPDAPREDAADAPSVQREGEGAANVA
ncbi:MAG: 50S ribosomal protein L3 [Parcubacteria group bacterium]|nr:50S ribosomal protein L3 [Parcubacteria group bacterium]